MSKSGNRTLDGAVQFDILFSQSWRRIVVVRGPEPSPYYAYIAFHTRSGEIRVSGEPHILKGGTDIFSLRADSYDKETWWPDFSREYGVRDFVQEWRARPVARLFEPPRKARFFTDDDFDEVEYTREAFLMRCVAMEFSAPEDPKPRLLITAEQCNVSVFIDEECEEAIKPYFIEYDPGPF